MSAAKIAPKKAGRVKAARRPDPLTPNMLRLLRLAAAGKKLTAAAPGEASSMGGLVHAVRALRKRGLLTLTDRLTPLGKAALKYAGT